MQPRTTAILFIVALLFGAFIYLYEIQGETAREDAVRESRRIFPDVVAESIDTLQFRSQDDRPFESVRTDFGWQIQSPIEFPGDDVNLDAIASTLANLKSEAAIESAGAPEIYGLGDSSKRIRFSVGEQDYTLEIGADTPVGGNVYVRNPAANREPKHVYTVASFRIDSLARDLDALRDRRVVTFDRARVNRVVAGWPGGSVSLVLSEAGWEISHPKHTAGKADSKAVEDLLSDVAFLRAVGFIDFAEPDRDDTDDTDDTENEAPGEADAGSDETYYTLRIGLDADESAAAAGQPLEVGFRVLGETGADEYRVQTTHPGVFYRVPRSRIDGLPRDVFAFRFKELSNFATADVQSFELTFNLQDAASSVEPVSVRVDRIATGWQAVGAAWRAGTAAGLIAEFARLEAVSVAAENPDDVTLAVLGLLPPQTVLRAYDASGELLAEVGLGVLDPDAGIAASAHGQAASYRLDPALAEQIPISLEAYRARFLSPPVEASAVE